MPRKKAYKDFVDCHLCGLPIPTQIVDVGHWLFATVDHIVPRSKGGTDAAANRAPAHRECNRYRGAREIDGKLRVQLVRHVGPKLMEGGLLPTHKIGKVRKALEKARRDPNG